MTLYKNTGSEESETALWLPVELETLFWPYHLRNASDIYVHISLAFLIDCVRHACLNHAYIIIFPLYYELCS